MIAGRVPGRTDNQVKNHWNTHLCKRLGIKKENRKTVVTSLKPHPRNADNTPKGLPPVEVGGGVTRRQSPLSSVKVSEQQPPEVGGYCLDSFSASNAELHSREGSPTSMEFLEGYYSLGDEFWQDL